MSNIFVKIFESIEAKSLSQDECKFQIKTGLEELDKSVGGFSPGELMLVAGSYGSGKTNLLVGMLKSFIKDDISCTFYSEEEPKNIAYKLLGWMSSNRAQPVSLV